MKLKKVLMSVTLALALVLMAALPVLADSYLSYYPIRIADTSGSPRTGYPVLLTVDGQALINAGLVSSSGLNSRVSVGVASEATNLIPNMMTTTEFPVWIENLPASGQAEIRLYTGYVPDNPDGFDILVGDGGKITRADDPDLRLFDEFEIEIDNAYINTDAGGTKNLVYKEDAFRIYINGATNITAMIPDSTLFASSTKDGHLRKSISVYATDWAATTATEAVSGTSATIGQHGATVNIWRAFFYFDTSALPNDAIITTAQLRLYGKTNESVDDFDVVIQTGSAGHPADTLVIADYDKTFYSGDGGSFNTTTFTTVDYNNIDLNATGRSWINLTGTTKLCIRSSKDIAGSAPTQEEYIEVYTNDEDGTDKDPQLVITYWAVPVTAVNVESGQHDIKVALSGGTFSISIDGATEVADDDYDEADFAGEVPGNGNDWLIMDNSTTQFMSYMGYYKHTTAIGEVSLKVHYEPATMLISTQVNGTCTANGAVGSLTDDVNLTQADGYWIGSYIIITDTGNGVPDGEHSWVTAFDQGTSTITFAPAMTAATEIGDTFTVVFSSLIDLVDGDENGAIIWGTNANVTLTYGEIVSYSATASTAGVEPGYEAPEADMPAEWYGTATNIENLPLYDMFNGIATETGIPVQTMYIFIITGVCFAFSVAGFLMFNSVMAAVVGIGVGLGIGSAMTIVPLWIMFTYLIMAIGIVFLKGRMGL